jgi:hypothetical protein
LKLLSFQATEASSNRTFGHSSFQAPMASPSYQTSFKSYKPAFVLFSIIPHQSSTNKTFFPTIAISLIYTLLTTE